ncbi:MAG: hypothetical protein ACREEM_39760, partial [Blastocatellia bacterium]
MTFLGARHLLKQYFGFALSLILVVLLAGGAIVRWPAQAQGGSQVATISAASFEKGPVAPGAIVSAFGSSLAANVEVAKPGPLPTMLAGTKVKITDSRNEARLAKLFFVAPTQINYIIPEDLADGDATVTITNSDGKESTGKVQIARAAPGLFTANANGKGVAAAVALRIKDGKYEPVARPDRSKECFVHEAIDLNPEDDRVFLILFGTGIRHAPDPDGDGNLRENIRVIIGGIEIKPDFAGGAPGFEGLDQINVELPRTLIGRGVVDCTITVDGFTTSSNRTTIEIKQSPNERGSPIVTGFSPPSVLAGKFLTINGMNFDPVKDKNLLLCGCTETRTMEEATETRLSAKVPFGTASGIIAVRTSKGQGES